MGEPAPVSRGWQREGIITALSAGFWLIMVGVIFLSTPDLIGKTVDFIEDFRIVQITGAPIFVPAPAVPRAHVVVYGAVATYSIVWGLFQVVVLGLRFFVRSSVDRKGRTASSALVGLATYYLIGVFLNESATLDRWFLFWASIIILIGASLIVRAAILLFGRAMR